MSKYEPQLRLYELIISLVTWLFVFLVTLHLWEIDHPDADYRLGYSLTNVALVSCVFLLNVTASVWRIYAQSSGQKILLLMQTLSLFLLLFLFPNGIVIILGIMWVAQLNEYVPTSLCFLFGSFLPAGYFLQIPEEHAWFNVILFCLLNYLAVYVFNRMISERNAKNEHANLLRELKATQSLLNSTIKRDERQRIARDLHDLMGHHLTALSLQLEIASQLENQDSVTHIHKARTIAENLLDSVREVVSEIRSYNQLDIKAALSTLVMDVDRLDIQLSISPDIKVSNTRLAELLLRITQEAVTNVIRHSNANQCSVQLDAQHGQLRLMIKDNGRPDKAWLPGNGLQGMTERVQAMDGVLILSAQDDGFELVATVPEML